MCYIFVGMVLLELSGNRIFGGVLRLMLKNVKKSSKNLLLYNSDLQTVNKSVEKFLKKSCKNIWWIRKKAPTLHPQNGNVLWLLNDNFSRAVGLKRWFEKKTEKKVVEKFGSSKNSLYLCSPFSI